jgi:transposase-like protein
MVYSEGFKRRMVERLASGASAHALSKEVGVSQPALSTWLREARRVRGVNESKIEAPSQPKRPEDWTPEERLQAVTEASTVSEAELGLWLRRKGLHEAQLREWRETVRQASLAALQPASKRSSGPSEEARRIKELEREVARKDKALAETTALLVLRKKLDALLGDEDDTTGPKSVKPSSRSSRKR